jgi:hypothetical protein
VGRIDKIRQGNIADVVANVSVHEAGHAVAYVVQFGIGALATQIKSGEQLCIRASPSRTRYTRPRKVSLKKITVFLAGGIGRRTGIFGDEQCDRRALQRPRAGDPCWPWITSAGYGFDERYQANYTLGIRPRDGQIYATDKDVEAMIDQHGEKKPVPYLAKHRDFSARPLPGTQRKRQYGRQRRG